jgi:GT2 family glycosyltransferase
MSLPVVIIPSRKAANLVACLTALRKHEPDCPVIVVDDGVEWPSAHDKTPREQWVGTHLSSIPGVKPFIFARNVNIGIRAAGESDVVLLNDDALLESPGGFQLMQKVALNRPDIGIIGATTNLTGQPLQRPQNVGLRIVPHIAFVCVLIPFRTREVLSDKTGFAPFTDGFLDERYTSYGSDDLDYCMQVEHAGLKVAVHDGCFVDHSKLHSSFRGRPEAAGDIWVNHRLLRQKWGMPPNPDDPEQKRKR